MKIILSSHIRPVKTKMSHIDSPALRLQAMFLFPLFICLLYLFSNIIQVYTYLHDCILDDMTKGKDGGGACLEAEREKNPPQLHTSADGRLWSCSTFRLEAHRRNVAAGDGDSAHQSRVFASCCPPLGMRVCSELSNVILLWPPPFTPPLPQTSSSAHFQLHSQNSTSFDIHHPLNYTPTDLHLIWPAPALTSTSCALHPLRVKNAVWWTCIVDDEEATLESGIENKGLKMGRETGVRIYFFNLFFLLSHQFTLLECLINLMGILCSAVCLLLFISLPIGTIMV